MKQYHLICESKLKIGLIGSSYYAGVVATVILVPWLADNYGRKVPLVTNYIVFLGAALGIVLSHDLNWLYVYLFIGGMTFGARIIVALNYLVEFYP